MNYKRHACDEFYQDIHSHDCGASALALADESRAMYPCIRCLFQRAERRADVCSECRASSLALAGGSAKRTPEPGDTWRLSQEERFVPAGSFTFLGIASVGLDGSVVWMTSLSYAIKTQSDGTLPDAWTFVRGAEQNAAWLGAVGDGVTDVAKPNSILSRDWSTRGELSDLVASLAATYAPGAGTQVTDNANGWIGVNIYGCPTANIAAMREIIMRLGPAYVQVYVMNMCKHGVSEAAIGVVDNASAQLQRIADAAAEAALAISRRTWSNLSEAFASLWCAMETERGAAICREQFTRDALALKPRDLEFAGWRAVVLNRAEPQTSHLDHRRYHWEAFRYSSPAEAASQFEGLIRGTWGDISAELLARDVYEAALRQPARVVGPWTWRKGAKR